MSSRFHITHPLINTTNAYPIHIRIHIQIQRIPYCPMLLKWIKIIFLKELTEILNQDNDQKSMLKSC